MSNLKDFLIGQRILGEYKSKYNGLLTVVSDLAWGKHIKAGGLTQSGGVGEKVWRTSLEKLKKEDVKTSLILGLGGGSIAKIIREFWPKSSIAGVEIDPLMIKLGKEFLGLSSWDVEIVEGDALEFALNEKRKYDLVCVDTYVGDSYPVQFESEEFLVGVGKMLSSNGTLVFNRLYYGDKRALANNFEKKLTQVFDTVERIYPEANVMFICRN